MAKKKKKRKKGFGLVVIEWILGLAIIIGIGIAFCYFFCKVKDVSVEGTKLYSTVEIIDYILDDELCDNAVYAVVSNHFFPKDGLEFISDFEVKMTSLNTIVIVCNEKPILGYMENNPSEYIYFNYDGRIAQISSHYVDGYIKVEGVMCEEPMEGDLLDIGDRQVGYLVALIKAVEKYDLIPNVISYNSRGDVTLIYDSYNIVLGDVEYLEEKMERITHILPSIEQMEGTLHVENYSPNSTDIVFEKKMEITE